MKILHSDFEIIDTYGMPPNFNSDFLEVVIWKFNQPLHSEILNQLESFCQKSNNKWEKKRDEYILTLDKTDIEHYNDHYRTIIIKPEEMIISEGRV